MLLFWIVHLLAAIFAPAALPFTLLAHFIIFIMTLVDGGGNG